jgi:glycosyltransferase involved in cell wall biosynthesis
LYAREFESKGIKVVLGRGEMNRGVGYAKNAAIQQCTSDCLCFLDADDVMDARRIELQIKMAVRILNVPFKLRISIGFAVAD